MIKITPQKNKRSRKRKRERERERERKPGRKQAGVSLSPSSLRTFKNSRSQHKRFPETASVHLIQQILKATGKPGRVGGHRGPAGGAGRHRATSLAERRRVKPCAPEKMGPVGGPGLRCASAFSWSRLGGSTEAFGSSSGMRRIQRVSVRRLPAHIPIYQCAIIEMARLAAGGWKGIMHDDRRHLAPEPEGCLMLLKYTSCVCVCAQRLRFSCTESCFFSPVCFSDV